MSVSSVLEKVLSASISNVPSIKSEHILITQVYCNNE